MSLISKHMERAGKPVSCAEIQTPCKYSVTFVLFMYIYKDLVRENSTPGDWQSAKLKAWAVKNTFFKKQFKKF